MTKGSNSAYEDPNSRTHRHLHLWSCPALDGCQHPRAAIESGCSCLVCLYGTRMRAYLSFCSLQYKFLSFFLSSQFWVVKNLRPCKSRQRKSPLHLASVAKPHKSIDGLLIPLKYIPVILDQYLHWDGVFARFMLYLRGLAINARRIQGTKQGDQ